MSPRPTHRWTVELTICLASAVHAHEAVVHLSAWNSTTEGSRNSRQLLQYDDARKMSLRAVRTDS